MKTSFIYLVLSFVISINAVNAQNRNPINYLGSLPAGLTLDKSAKRSYRMTTDYYDFDLKSNFLRKQRLVGCITYEGDSAQWKDVYYSQSKALDAAFPQGIKKRGFLQNFQYQPDEKVLTPEFFKNNLPEADPLIMNLIWDALGFDALAYCCWDSLKLGEEFRAKNMNFEVKIADIGTFENKDIRITWLGITEINNKICAILKYSVMNNPLSIEYENMSMNGRSHYWGEIYVSLSDKQIEYANLTEDVLTDVNFKGQANNRLGYTVRNINMSRVE
jgi:hypothetical protein